MFPEKQTPHQKNSSLLFQGTDILQMTKKYTMGMANTHLHIGLKVNA